MTLKQAHSINQLFLDLFKVNQSLEKQVANFYTEKEFATQEFIYELINEGRKEGLLYLSQSLNNAEILELLEAQVPILVFCKIEEHAEPVVVQKVKREIKQFYKDVSTFTSIAESDLLTNMLLNEEGKYIVVTCIPASELGADNTFASSNPLKSFLKLLSTEKREIFYIYLYAIIGGIISLSLPLGIQSIINFISSGQVSTSVIVLITLIVFGLLLSGGMQIMQLFIVEHIQQKLYAKIAFNIADRIPKVNMEAILKYYPPELVNRFFDILTIQKSLSSILIDLTSAGLQIFFGLLLLSLYHPYFIFFGIVLVGMLLSILYITGPRGLATSNAESKYKYKLAYWLEEVARTLHTFKLAGNSNLPLEKTDYYISHYLKARKKHFRVLMGQYLGFVGFKTIITGGLLILGCILVINKEINIGQFVASEIIIILIMSAVEKVIIKLEKVYDTLTSTSKLEHLTTLPVERRNGLNLSMLPLSNGLSIKIKDLKYKYPDSNIYTLNGLDLDIFPSERVCFTGPNGSGKTTLINVLLGLFDSYEGSIIYNGLSLKDIDKSSFYNLIGNNLSDGEIFQSSFLENITLGRKDISMEKLIWAIELVGLQNFISKLPDGLKTEIVGGTIGLPKNVIYKMILARSIINMPKLLVLDDFLLGIEKREKFHLLNLLMDKKFGWTIIIISTDEEVMKLCDKTVVLQCGKNVFQGKYEKYNSPEIFKELI